MDCCFPRPLLGTIMSELGCVFSSELSVAPTIPRTDRRKDAEMGHVYHDVTLIADREVCLEMLVDTGATYTVISADLAQQVGIQTVDRRYSVRLADGSEVSM